MRQKVKTMHLLMHLGDQTHSTPFIAIGLSEVRENQQ
jgi:hypothetical protein